MGKAPKKRVYVNSEYLELLRLFDPVYKEMSDAALMDYLLVNEVQKVRVNGVQPTSLTPPLNESESNQVVEEDENLCDITDDLD